LELLKKRKRKKQQQQKTTEEWILDQSKLAIHNDFVDIMMVFEVFFFTIQ